MCTIVDLGISNIGSVARAFERSGVQVRVSRNPADIESARALVLPGVGAFGDGMASLREMCLIGPLCESARAGIPLLGFCLGMQLLADESEEHGLHEGLGLIPGRVVRLNSGPNERVPNIGWCDVYPKQDARLFRGISSGDSFYCVHSYQMRCREATAVAATIEFGNDDVTIAVEHKNIFGLQFHPEKSQDAGLIVLNEFLNIVKSRG